MILDQAMNLMEKLVNEIRDTEPEKRDHFLNTAAVLFDISAEALKTSPGFRRGFALVHSEFLKYPECRETIEKSIEAYKTYVDQ